MLPLQFDDIGSDAILKLIEERTPERKTLEYKAKLNINTGDEKAEFLADISSFANASGGDIIFGVSDQRDSGGNATGIPQAINSLTIANPDSELGRISQIIEAGIQPRVSGVQVKIIEIPERGPIIVIRVPKSWNAPHMVSFANRSRFYSRNGLCGRLQLDVQQIGAAFAVQRTIGERLRAWKADRIGKMVAGDGPMSFQGPRLLFHFVSASALSDEQSLPKVFNLQELYRLNGLMSIGSSSYRYNADGLLYESIGTDSGGSYLQIFREGHLEYGDSYSMGGHEGGIASGRLEDRIQETFANALALSKKLAVEEPIFASLTLIGVKGLTMWLPEQVAMNFGSSKSPAFDRPLILSPDVMLQNLGEGAPYPSTLLPIVNAIWQAAGLEKTPNTSRWESAAKGSAKHT